MFLLSTECTTASAPLPTFDRELDQPLLRPEVPPPWLLAAGLATDLSIPPIDLQSSPRDPRDYTRVIDEEAQKKIHSPEVRMPRFGLRLSDPLGHTLNYSPTSGVAIRVTADRPCGFVIFTVC